MQNIEVQTLILILEAIMHPSERWVAHKSSIVPLLSESFVDTVMKWEFELRRRVKNGDTKYLQESTMLVRGRR